MAVGTASTRGPVPRDHDIGGDRGALLVGTGEAAVLPPSGSVYTGVTVDGSRGLVAELDAYTGSAGGKRPAVVVDYRDWAHDPDFPTGFADLVAARGAIPLLTWEPWDRAAGVDQPAHHEMNGNWYPWAESVNGNRPGQYVAAHRRVVSLFRSVGATNVTWVWSPNVSYPGSTALAGLYPGDAYADWTALDGDNRGTTAATGRQSFEQVFGPSIAQVRALSTRPLMLAEIGSAERGGDEAAWIADFFRRLAARPDVRGYVWFDHDKEADWRIQSSTPSRLAYARGVAAPRHPAEPPVE